MIKGQRNPNAITERDRVAFIEQYRTLGFRQMTPTSQPGAATTLLQALGHDARADVAMTLDLAAWVSRP